MFQVFYHRLTSWLFDPPEHALAKSMQPALILLRYPYALMRDLANGQLNLRAMSLVYSTLMSIAPLLALAFSVLKGLGYDQDLEVVLYAFLEPIGDRASEITARIMGFVNSVRGDVLGAIGLAFLLYTVVSAVQKVEECFNYIWQVAKPRSWARRFSEYLSVMIIGPVFVVALVALLRSNAIALLGRVTGIAWTLEHIQHFASFMAISAGLAFLYRFIPNTAVRLRPAVIGGLAAGALWTTGGVLFTHFVASSTQTALIYAGFAIVIVTLFWLYMSWLILLLGAQVAFYVQHPQTLRNGHRVVHLTPALCERLGLSVMYLVARDYRTGVSRWTLNELSDHFSVPANALKPVIEILESHELLTTTELERYLPGRDPGHITLSEILDALRNDERNPRIPGVRGAAAAEAVAQTAAAAMKLSVKDQTLESLVSQDA
jgi:membrane protein